jgi:hypothetical protein
MSKLKFIAIDSLKQEDLTELFALICKNILLKDSKEVIREVKGLTDKEAFSTKEPSANDILQVISIYDIAFELKLNYIDAAVKPIVVAPEAKSEGLIEDKGNALMEEQKKEVKIEPFKEGKIIESILPESQLPDFT